MKSTLSPGTLPLRRVSALAFASALAATAHAVTINYTDFSSVAGLQINGNAHQQGNVLRLTDASGYQSGSAFSQSAVTLGANVSFSSFFAFRITNSGGAGGGADGLTFTVQTVSNTSGGAGGGLGYSGILKSVAIEFDTYDNGSGDGYNNNHVGIDVNGNVNSVARANVATSFKDGNVKYVWVDYDGASDSLQVRLSDSAIRPLAALLSHTVDLTSVLQGTNAFAGFTSGTGAGWGNHDILTWEFRDTFAPVGVPETATTPFLLSPVLLALVALARRRNLS